MRSEARVPAPGREFVIVGTVRGLASEAARVEEAYERAQPDVVALGIGPEDLEGLRQLEAGASYEHDFSVSDEVYAHFLAQFGAVELPPRDLRAALRIATERGVPVVPIDLPEVDYVDAFTKAISGWQLLRYNRRVRHLAKRPPAAEDAMDFHLGWDRAIGRLRGFAELERLREQRMAASLVGDARIRGRVLVLVEGARVEGLAAALRTLTVESKHQTTDMKV